MGIVQCSKEKYNNRWMAIVGLVVGIITIIIMITAMVMNVL